MPFTEQEKQIILYGKANGKSQQEVQSALVRLRTGNPVTTKPIESADTGPNFGQRLVKNVENFAKDTVKSVKKQGEGLKQDLIQINKGHENDSFLKRLKTLPETALAVAGRTGRAVGGIVGAGAEATAKTVLSSKEKTAIKNTVVEAIQSSTGQKVVGSFKKVAGHYNEWKSLHPERAMNLENAIGIADLATTLAGVGAAKKGAEVAAKAGQEVVEGIGKAAKSGAETIGKTAKNVAGDIGQGAKVIASKVLPKATTPLEDAIKLTTPVLSKKSAIETLAKTGLKDAGVETKGAFKTWETVMTKRSSQIAKDVAPLVDKQNPVLGTIAKVNSKIGQLSEDVIRPALKADPAPFNLKTLNKRLKDIVPPTIFKSDKTIQNAYKDIKSTFIEIVKKYPKTREGLLDARIEFYQLAKSQGKVLGKEAKGVVDQAISDVAQTANEFIGKGLKEVNGQSFTDLLHQQSRLYEAARRIAENNYKSLGKNAIQRWIKSNPLAASAVKKAATFAGLGIVF